MSRLTPQRTLAAFKVMVLVGGLSATVAYSADRARSKATPRGEPALVTFKISGRLARPLRPGTAQPLDLKLTNPHRWDLAVDKISIALAVDDTHRKAGCTGTTHYRVLRMRRRASPLRVGARRTRTLRQLGVRSLPRIAMQNLPRNQDACKGARLRLRFVGRAARWRGPYTR